jgi:hypothetical protein
MEMEVQIDGTPETLDNVTDSGCRYSSGRGCVLTHPTSTLTIAHPAQPWEASGLVAIVPHGVHSWSCIR